MSIWLEGRSIGDLVKIPLYLDCGRLTVEPNKDNHVYDLCGHYVHYSIIPAEKDFRTFGFYHISKQIARSIRAEHIFFDTSSYRQQFNYWSIELWDRIPLKFRDVFFFHEVVESIHREKGLIQPEAHAIASGAHKAYIARCLAAEEQVKFKIAERFLESAQNLYK